MHKTVYPIKAHIDGRLTRSELHRALDMQLDEWQFEEDIPIERGMIRIEVQIENGRKTITIAERSLTREQK